MQVTWMEDELGLGIYLIPRGSILCPNLGKNEVLLGQLESRWKRALEKQDYTLSVIFENPQISQLYD